jgi:hypothetical protein
MEITIQPASLERFEGFWRGLDAVAQERCYLQSTEGPAIEKTVEFVEDVLMALLQAGNSG